MNNKLLAISAALLITYGTSASAEQISVNVTATINNVNDPNGVVSDILPGQMITGTYTYETTTADMDPSPTIGLYPHTSSSGEMNLVTGAYSFKTNSNAVMPLEIHIDNEAWSYTESYHVISMDNEPTNGAFIQDVGLSLWDSGPNDVITSDALLPTVPNPQAFDGGNNVFISGTKNGYSFFLEAQIDSMSSEATTPPVSANNTQYIYTMVAVVDYVNDYTQTLNGKLQAGDYITASYTIDSTTLGLTSPYDPAYEKIYTHAPGTGATSVTFNGITLSTRAEAATPEVLVRDDVSTGFDHFLLTGKQLESNDPTLAAERMEIFFGGNGDTLSSTAMPTDNNSLAMWQDGFVYLTESEIYPNWSFTARIISMEMVPTQTLEIVPGDAYIHPAMRFDAAFNLSNSAPITGITGTLNGQDISSYLLGCQTFASIGNVQSIICPDTHLMLSPGDNSLSIDVSTENGGNISNSTTWTTP